MADRTIPAFKILRGNLGVGTTLPGSLFNVYVASQRQLDFYGGTSPSGNNYVAALKLGRGKASNSALEIKYDSEGSEHAYISRLYSNAVLHFDKAGTDHMTILANGNVGIGTNAPVKKLDVRAAASWDGIHIGSTAGSATAIDFARSATSANPTARIGVAEPAATHTSDMRFFTSDASGSAPNLVEKMRIDQNGKVGIGTNAPGSLLNVGSSASANTTIRINSSLTAGSDAAAFSFGLDNHAFDFAGMRLDYSDRVTKGLEIFTATAYGYPITITPSTNKNIILNPSGTGKVLIEGTSSYLLDVQQTAVAWTARFENNGGAYGISIDTANNIANNVANLACYTPSGVGLFFTNQGRLAIGLTAPAAALHVSSSASVVSYIIRPSASPTVHIGSATSAGAQLGYVHAQDYAFYGHDADYDAIVVKSSGNVGIGTTNPRGALEVWQFDTADPTLVLRGLASSGYTTKYPKIDFYGAYGSGDGYLTGRIYNGFVTGGGWTDTQMRLAVPNSSGTMTDVMTLRDGNVGIGTVTPAAPLNVTSAYSASATTTAIKVSTVGGYNAISGVSIDFGNDQGSYATWLTGQIASRKDGGSWKGALTFSTNNDSSATDLVERMRINGVGNVGIGTNNPGYPLQVYYAGGAGIGMQVKGTANRAKLVVTDNDTSAYVIAEDSHASFGRQDSLSTNNLNINSDGSVGIGTNAASTFCKLNVKGAVRLGRGSDDLGSYNGDDFDLFVGYGANGSKIMLYDDQSAYHSALIQYGNALLRIGLNNSNSAPTIRDDSAINIIPAGVGIGIGVFTARLAVKSAGSTTDQIVVVHSGNSVEIAQLGQSANGSSAGTLLLKNNSGTDKIYLDAAGASYMYTDLSIGTATTKLKTYSDSTYSGIYNGSSLASDESIYFGAGTTYFINDGSSSLVIDSNQRVQLKGTDYQLQYVSGSHIWYTRLQSNGTFAIHKNGVGDYLSVTSAGFVGIGTGSTMSSSNEKLGVYSASAGHSSFKNASDSTGTVYIRNVSQTANTWQPYLILADSGGNRGGLALKYSTAGLKVHGQGGIEFWTGSSFGGGTVKMTIASGGEVGIKGVAGGGTDLSLGGPGVTSHGTLVFNNGGGSAIGKIRAEGSDDSFYVSKLAGGGLFHFTSNNSFQFHQNMGIGTAPSHKLEVHDASSNVPVHFTSGTTSVNIKAGSNTQTQFTNLLLYTNGGNGQIWKAGSAYTAYGGANSLNIYNDTGKIAFHPAGNANEVVIATNGCVGIGTDNPGGRLAIRTTANEKSLWMAPSAATTANVLHMECDSLTTGSGVYIHSNTSNNSGRKLVYINNDHSSATGTTCLYINQDSTGPAVKIDKTNVASGGDFNFIEMDYSGSWGSNLGGIAAISASDGNGRIGRYGIAYAAGGGRFVVTDLYDGGYGASGDVFYVRGDGDAYFQGSVGIATDNPTEKLHVLGNAKVTGSITGASKSFLIDHPTKENKKLEHGSLEGPEFGVYYRGRAQSNTITLPDYWTALVREETITVQLTSNGSFQHLYVVSQSLTEIVIGAADGETIDCFYTVYGERADIDSLVVEKEV